MSDPDTKPTPPSGMPAVVAATLADEATKDGSTTMILAAVESLRGDVTTFRDEVTARLESLEKKTDRVEAKADRADAKTDAHGTVLGRLTNEVAAHSAQMADLAAAQVSTARAASAAAEISAQALAKANSSQDENAKMIQSAMVIQKDAVAAAVTDAVAPVFAKIGSLESNDQAQNRALAALKVSDDGTTDTLKAHGEKIGAIDTKVDGVAKSVNGVVTSVGTIASGVTKIGTKLATWQDAWWVKAALALAVFAGGFAGAFYATRQAPPVQTTTIVSPPSLPPAPSPTSPSR